MRLETLDWNDLRYFLAAARAGTLAGAARLLGVKHPTVGRRLDALERAIGAALVIRTETGIRLTPLGETLVGHAEQVERSVEELKGRAAAQTATVRIAVPTGFASFFTAHLPQLLAELRSKHPHTSLDFLSSLQPVDLARGEAELALRIGPIADETLVAQKVGEIGWSLYASPRYLARHPAPADPRDLSGHEVLGFNSTVSRLPGARWLAAHGAGATKVLLHGEIEDMLAAAVAGVGLAVLPCILADRESGLHRLTPEVLESQNLSIVYRRDVLLSKPVETVLRFLAEVTRTEMRALRGA